MKLQHMKEQKQFLHLNGEIAAVYHDAALKMGLSDSAMDILYTVCVMDGKCYLAEIARLSGVSRQTIHSAIGRLEADGLIYLEKGNKRNRYVCLTQKGEALCGERVAPVIAAEEAVWNGWTEADRQTYFRLSKAYLQDMRTQVDAMMDRRKGESNADSSV